MKFHSLYFAASFFLFAICFASCVKESPAEHKSFSVSLPERCDTVLHKGATVSVAFRITTDLAPKKINVEITKSDGADSSISYNKDKKTGRLDYTVGADSAEIILRVSDGKTHKDFYIYVSTYYLRLQVDNEIIVPEEGKNYSFAIESNLLDKDISLESDEWISSTMENRHLFIEIAANRTIDERFGRVHVSERGNPQESICIEFRQDWLLVNGEGMVQFKDKRFKKAVLALADDNNDLDISMQEAGGLKEITAIGKSIEDIRGIECFPSIEKLDLRNNNIKQVVLDNPGVFSNLKYIDLTGNAELEHTINISGCYAGLGIYFAIDNKYSHDIITQEPAFYESSDFSFDGLHHIEEHSEGNGIHLVFYTTAYIDKDYQNGAARELIDHQVQLLFSIEPFASFRNYFDISYFVFTAPNANKRAKINDSPELFQRLQAILDDTERYCIGIGLNTDGHKGEGIRANATRFIYEDFGSHHGWVNLVEKRRVFNETISSSSTLAHEMGHALGGLEDEYTEDRVHDDRGTPNFTKDISSLPWQRFLDHEHYRNRVGVFPRNEGYVPSENSMMGNHRQTPFFNSPSRYAIFRNIIYLSAWTANIKPYEWVYPDPWEEFLEYDIINDDLSI